MSNDQQHLSAGPECHNLEEPQQPPSPLIEQYQRLILDKNTKVQDLGPQAGSDALGHLMTYQSANRRNELSVLLLRGQNGNADVQELIFDPITEQWEHYRLTRGGAERTDVSWRVLHNNGITNMAVEIDPITNLVKSETGFFQTKMAMLFRALPTPSIRTALRPHATRAIKIPSALTQRSGPLDPNSVASLSRTHLKSGEQKCRDLDGGHSHITDNRKISILLCGCPDIGPSIESN